LFLIEESEARKPISVKFEIPYFTVSGIQVELLTTTTNYLYNEMEFTLRKACFEVLRNI